MSWLSKLFGGKAKAEEPQTPEQRDYAMLNKNTCPDCNGVEWLNGPRGCGSQNIECATCGSDFNVYPEDGPAYFTVERIGWNNSGRWEEKGKLKAAKPTAA